MYFVQFSTLCKRHLNSVHEFWQDRQCTYNVTYRRFRVTIVVVEKQRVLRVKTLCLWPHWSSMQCACAILISVAWPPLQYFPHYLINGTVFEKKIIEHKMCVLIFCTTFVWNISYSKKKWTRYDDRLHRYSCTGYYCQLLIKLEFSRQIFEKYTEKYFQKSA